MAQIVLWWPYSFPNSLSPSLLPLLHLPVSPLLFLFFLSSSSQILSSFKGRRSRHSICIHLFSFCCHFLCTGPWQCGFEEIIKILLCFFCLPHDFLGKPVLGKYGNYTLCIYEFVEIYHLLHFATALSI